LIYYNERWDGEFPSLFLDSVSIFSKKFFKHIQKTQMKKKRKSFFDLNVKKNHFWKAFFLCISFFSILELSKYGLINWNLHPLDQKENQDHSPTLFPSDSSRESNGLKKLYQ